MTSSVNSSPLPAEPVRKRWIAAALPPLFAMVLPIGQLAANRSLISSWWLILTAPLVAAAIGWTLAAVCWLAIRAPWQRSLVATALVLTFFGFGHLQNLAGDNSRFSTPLLLWLWIGGGLSLAYWLRAWPAQRAEHVCRWGVLLTCFALVLQVGTLALGLSKDTSLLPTKDEPARRLASGDRPDIYYLVLDAYGRQDVLAELYSFDNEPFLRELEKRGFTVSRQARSNYNQTALSLASSLNLDYLDRLIEVSPRLESRLPLQLLIMDSVVDRQLRAAGYRTISLATGYSYTQRRRSDRFVPLTPWDEFDECQLALADATILGPLLRDRSLRAHEARVRGGLAAIPDLAAREAGPKFVMAHIVCPHPPFVFDGQGKSVWQTRTLADGNHLVGPYFSRERYRRCYGEQLRFVNSRVLATIDGILAKSARPPIIVLQADHGPASELVVESPDESNVVERFGILSAIYTPPALGLKFADDHSPVNTFRLVLNAVCGTNYERLPSRCYFGLWKRPFELTDVTDRVRRGGAAEGRHLARD
ncbi:MAG: hypothetical protein SFU86_13600 [Pirellulaceae bacterium]|nr:hypothetical protein [Pirellulaceae bacterium]